MSVEVRQNIYAAWLDGDATSVEALRSLCADYEEIDTSYKDFERIRATVRERIATVLCKLGDKAQVPGFGVLSMTAPSVTTSYDKSQVNALIAELRAEGNDALADRLAGCAVQSMRAGGLRIEREKDPARK